MKGQLDTTEEELKTEEVEGQHPPPPANVTWQLPVEM